MKKLYVEKRAENWHLAVIDNGLPIFGLITSSRDVATAFIINADINFVVIKEQKNDKGAENK